MNKSVSVDRQESADATCPVCHEKKEIVAIGSCDHPICHRCSTRLRVICETDECPICRTEQPKVLFLSQATTKKFSDINSSDFIFNHHSKVLFENKAVETAYWELVDHVCPECKERFKERNFRGFKDHMRRKHLLFFCDICVSALKIFTHDRKLYNRQQLATHRRQGDPGDSSYKGHPLCQFCDERYLDDEELFKHLRKEHYYCHFCEERGSKDYYNDYAELRNHFQREHFLCEEADCYNVQFTNAFRSSIDLKAHMATMHADKSMSRSQARQARALDVEFPLVPRKRERDRGVISHEDYTETRGAGRGADDSRRGHGPGRGRDRGGRPPRYKDNELGLALQASLNVMKEKEQEEPTQVEEVEPESKSPILKNDLDNFPSLGGRSTPEQKTESAVSENTYGLAKKLALSSKQTVKHGSLGEEAFPSLGSSTPDSFPTAQKPDSTDQGGNTKKNSGKPTKDTKGNKPTKPLVSNNFKKSKVTDEEFPELTRKSSGNKSESEVKPSPAVWITKPTKTASVPNYASTKSSNSSEKSSSKEVIGKIQNSSNSFSSSVSVACAPSYTCDDKDFPTLGGGRSNKPTPVSVVSAPSYTRDDKDFPTLGGGNAKKPSPVSVVSAPSYTCNDKDFPTLGGGSANKPTAQWLTKPGKSKVNNNVVNLQHPTHDKKTFAKTPVTATPYITSTDKNKSGSGSSSSDKKNKKNKSSTSSSDGSTRQKGKENIHSVSLSNIAGSMLNGDSYAGEQARSTVADKVIREQNGQEQTCPLEAESNIKLVSQEEIGEMKKPKEEKKAKSNFKPKLTEDDFPTLGHSNDVSSTKQDLPKPPPGFSNVLKLQPSDNTESEALSAQNDSDLSVTTTEHEEPLFTYCQPNDFLDRNRQLVSSVNDLLDNDQSKFQMFKSVSGQFRQEVISASEYFDRCNNLFGHENFSVLFPELLALLPDIPKQKEMLSACERKCEDMLYSVSKNNKKRTGWNDRVKLISSCPTCEQVLLKKDVDDHFKQHDIFCTDYPTLPSPKSKPQYGLKPFDLTTN